MGKKGTFYFCDKTRTSVLSLAHWSLFTTITRKHEIAKNELFPRRMHLFRPFVLSRFRVEKLFGLDLRRTTDAD